MAKIECVCPKTTTGNARHPNGDTINLRERLDFRAALTARNTVILIKQEDPEATAADILAALTEVYLLVGIKSWSLVDARGKPIEPNRATIREFIAEHPEEAMAIGDEADMLYSEAVISPLVARASTYSPPTPIDGSTSATNGSLPVRRKRSRQSLTSITQTEDTAKMSASPGGGYS